MDIIAILIAAFLGLIFFGIVFGIASAISPFLPSWTWAIIIGLLGLFFIWIYIQIGGRD